MACALVGFVAAQPRPQSEANLEGLPGARLETITVTAKKREQNILEIPASLSILLLDDLEQRGIKDLVDIGKVVPNMTVVTFGAGTPASAMPFIRGIGLQDHLILTDPRVGVYVDGVYLGRQIGQNWGLSNIERVEVLRGPQGTIWGRNSIGGSVNIVTRRPDQTPVTRFGLEAGTRGRINANFYRNTIVSKHVALSANGAFKQRDGVGKFVNIPDTGREVGQLRDISGRFELLIKSTDRFSLLIVADGNEGSHGLNPYTTEILPGRSLDNAGLRASDISANPYDNNTGQRELTSTENLAYGLATTATWKFNDSISTKAIFSSRHSDYSAGLDDDSTETNFLAFPEEGKADQMSIEWQTSGDLASMNFVTGLYYFKEKGRAHQPDATFNRMPSALEIRQRVRSFGLYGTLGYHLSNDLRVSAGLRYTQDDKNASVNINNGAATSSGSREWRNFSWNLDASYYLNPHLTFYASIANGYQSGAFPPRPYCLFVDAACFTAGDHITAINYETGFRGRISNRIWGSVAIFYTNYSDLPYQVSTTTGSGFDTRNVIVNQRAAGLEWEGQIVLAPWLSIYSSLGYIDVNVEGVSVAPLTPELTASISPELVYDMSGGGRTTLRLDYSWRGKMFGESASGDPRRGTVLSRRHLLNFYLGYLSVNQRYEIGMYGRNITDKRYTNAALNTGDYILSILSNDASEFGVRLQVNL